MEPIKLTQYSHGGGCGCKISPAVLKSILGNNSQPKFPNLLVGNESNDDAAALDLGNGTALISTTDFFMPIVNDPFSFGKIAACNAISDVYAMGGKPVLAIAILGWPVTKLSAEVANEVLNGARAVCNEANIPLAGGHSIDSPEPIFGLAVNGIVDIKNLKQNNTAKAGDLLFLTKPLGFGMITTAAKRGLADESDINSAIKFMTTLNSAGEQFGRLEGVHALTDVTGFGLLGHLIELAEGSNLTAEISYEDLPKMHNIESYISRFIYPDMTMKNYSTYSDKVNELNANQLYLCCDPQTSGGLLVAVSPDSVNEFMDVINSCSLDSIVTKPIGRLTEKQDKVVIIQ